MTVAETLREWADGADEEMAGPLRELAAQYDAEVRALEQNVLAPIAEALAPLGDTVEPETFAVLARLRELIDANEKLAKSARELNEKRAAAKATVAETKTKRAKAVAAIDQAVESIRRAVITIGDLDLTPEQIAERATGRN